ADEVIYLHRLLENGHVGDAQRVLHQRVRAGESGEKHDSPSPELVLAQPAVSVDARRAARAEVDIEDGEVAAKRLLSLLQKLGEGASRHALVAGTDREISQHGEQIVVVLENQNSAHFECNVWARRATSSQGAIHPCTTLLPHAEQSGAARGGMLTTRQALL